MGQRVRRIRLRTLAKSFPPEAGRRLPSVLERQQPFARRGQVLAGKAHAAATKSRSPRGGHSDTPAAPRTPPAPQHEHSRGRLAPTPPVTRSGSTRRACGGALKGRQSRGSARLGRQVRRSSGSCERASLGLRRRRGTGTPHPPGRQGNSPSKLVGAQPVPSSLPPARSCLLFPFQAHDSHSRPSARVPSERLPRLRAPVHRTVLSPATLLHTTSSE